MVKSVNNFYMFCVCISRHICSKTTCHDRPIFRLPITSWLCSARTSHNVHDTHRHQPVQINILRSDWMEFKWKTYLWLTSKLQTMDAMFSATATDSYSFDMIKGSTQNCMIVIVLRASESTSYLLCIVFVLLFDWPKIPRLLVEYRIITAHARQHHIHIKRFNSNESEMRVIAMKVFADWVMIYLTDE